MFADTPPPGTDPTVDKKAPVVRGMFNSIARRYDLANHLLSFGIDVLWRKRLHHLLSAQFAGKTRRILDACCGTGDLGLELSPLGTIIGADFAHLMLLHARQKSRKRKTCHSMYWVESDALHLPFAAESFDAVSVAFGIRNFENLEAGLRELAEVLRPGGILAVLEFSMPHSPLFSALYRHYFQSILPRLGGWITGNPNAYCYLPASVTLFSSPQEIATLMKRCGLVPFQLESWTGGIVCCYLARKEQAVE